MSSEDFNVRIMRGLNKVREAQTLLDSARKELGVCKICDDETRVLSKAAGDLVTVIDTARIQIGKTSSTSGLSELHTLAPRLAEDSAEAAKLQSETQEGEFSILPSFLRPSSMLNNLKKVGNPTSGKSGIPRPPLPHEILGIPLPGQAFRKLAGTE